MSDAAARDRDRMRHLMMAALDGEITPEERADLDRALADDPALRKEWERMSRVKDVTSSMALAEPPAEVWDDYWEEAYRKNERKIGWILVSVGAAIFGGWGLFEFVRAIFTDASMPALARFGLFALTLGGAVLAVSVLRERIFLHRRDPYREVKR